MKKLLLFAAIAFFAPCAVNAATFTNNTDVTVYARWGADFTNNTCPGITFSVAPGQTTGEITPPPCFTGVLLLNDSLPQGENDYNFIHTINANATTHVITRSRLRGVAKLLLDGAAPSN